MKCLRRALVLLIACLALGDALLFAAPSAKPKHINRSIELLEQGQPIYYTGSHNGTEGGFEQGKQDAQTYADYISYDMEHAPFDVKGLADYMRGLPADRRKAVTVHRPSLSTFQSTAPMKQPSAPTPGCLRKYSQLEFMGLC